MPSMAKYSLAAIVALVIASLVAASCTAVLDKSSDKIIGLILAIVAPTIISLMAYMRADENSSRLNQLHSDVQEVKDNVNA